MKLSMSTLGCPDWDFPTILQKYSALGADGIEVRVLEGHVEACDIPHFAAENRNATFNVLKDHGLELSCFGASTNFHGSDEDTMRMIEAAKTTIDTCSAMKIPFIRVFGDRITSPEAEETAIRKAGEGIKELCTYARGKNVGILMEVHGDYNTPNRLLKVAKIAGSPEFGILWDIEHSDKVFGDDIEAFYRPLAHLVRHIHVKNHIRLGDGRFQLCSIDEGDIPVPAIVAALEKDGFAGYFSYEWEKKWHPELADAQEEFPRYCAYMRAL